LRIEKYKRDEIIWSLRKLHNEEFQNFYSQNTIRMMNQYEERAELG
jgi:hypothetical protein